MIGGVAIALVLFSCSGPEAPVLPLAEAVRGQISIIPQPKSITVLPGEFLLSEDVKIVQVGDTGAAAEILSGILMDAGGVRPELAPDLVVNSILLSAISPELGFGEEGYFLRIEPETISIVGSKRGIFYGIQSLAQMLPVKFEKRAILPAVEIVDTPRFPYRGMHLDVARHFMSAEFVKKFIDQLSRYKYNYFHWHLTDDQGWRIEIEKYPILTDIGSKRSETVKASTYPRYVGDGIPVEGFYTQDQIRDIVSFAESRHITIIPEIDMPGHSSAALAAYPNLGCSPKYTYGVKTTWGGFPDVLCPKPDTFVFLKDVLDEVISLFPDSPYIHIGGDEVNEEHWNKSPNVIALQREHRLPTAKAVHGWFGQRIEDFVNSKQRRVVVWDEMIEAGLPRNAIVMVWRNVENGAKAAQAGHQVVMTPDDFLYFDRPQSADSKEPRGLGPPVPLEEIYSYEPIPNGLSQSASRNILGAQGCLWTEFMKTPQSVEYMAFPRLLALAEVLWSSPANKDYWQFSKRLGNELARLDGHDINYRIPRPHGLSDRLIRKEKDAILELESPVAGGRLYLTLDGTVPSELSTIYTGPIQVEPTKGGSTVVKLIVITSAGRRSSIFSARFRWLEIGEVVPSSRKGLALQKRGTGK